LIVHDSNPPFEIGAARIYGKTAELCETCPVIVAPCRKVYMEKGEKFVETRR